MTNCPTCCSSVSESKVGNGLAAFAFGKSGGRRGVLAAMARFRRNRRRECIWVVSYIRWLGRTCFQLGANLCRMREFGGGRPVLRCMASSLAVKFVGVDVGAVPLADIEVVQVIYADIVAVAEHRLILQHGLKSILQVVWGTATGV